jgi:hypothetical protein
MSGFGATGEHRVIAAQLSSAIKIAKRSDAADAKKNQRLEFAFRRAQPIAVISQRQPTIVFTSAQLKIPSRG